MKEQKKPEQRLLSNKPLKYDRAMQEAAKRAQSHPRLISMTSKVKDDK
jgi:hypothetical protein